MAIRGVDLLPSRFTTATGSITDRELLRRCLDGVTGVLHAADPAAAGVRGGAQDPEILRGGAWIGVLERAALTATLLAGWPEGLAVVAAVKGLGRFAELRSPAAAERFIVGTLASALWAAACAGLALLLRS